LITFEKIQLLENLFKKWSKTF